MQTNNHLFEDQTTRMVSEHFTMPLESSQSSHQAFKATTEKAMQFKKDIEFIDEMLQNTNTINFEELRSETQRSHQVSSRDGDDPQNRLDKTQKRNLMDKENRCDGGLNRDVSFDFIKIKESKEINMQQAFQENLKTKKHQILELEAQYMHLTQSQNLRLTKLSHLKNQRELYQHQYKAATMKRKSDLSSVKEALKLIEAKMEEYTLMHSQTVQDINLRQNQELKSRDQLQAKLSELNGQIQKTFIMDDSSSDRRHLDDDFQDEQRESLLKMQMQDELVDSLKKKAKEVQANVNRLQDFIKQSSEESCMTNEDILSKQFKKAELIAQREELDQMYEMGQNSAGQEFHLFLKLEQVIKIAGQSSTQFIEMEYEQMKALSFYNDIVGQIISLLRPEDTDQLRIIQKSQEVVRQKSVTLETKKIISLLANLTKEINMEIDQSLLLEKFQASSNEKDKIYQKKSLTLQDVKSEIKQFQSHVSRIQNSINNVLKPQAIAFEQTLKNSKFKLSQLKSQQQTLDDKLVQTRQELIQIKDRSEQTHQRILSQINLNGLKQKATEIKMTIDSQIQRIQKLEFDKNNIQEQYEKSIKILQDKRQEAQQKQHIFDPMTTNSYLLQTGRTHLVTPDDDLHEDDQIRTILESIDVKIGLAIEEKERESQTTQTMQMQIQVAKEGFTSAYKHYKAIKRDSDGARLRQEEATRLNKFNQLNEQMTVSKGELLSNMPQCMFSSDKKSGIEGQFISFSQQSAANTPFKQVENIVYHNNQNMFSPMQDRIVSGQQIIHKAYHQSSTSNKKSTATYKQEPIQHDFMTKLDLNWEKNHKVLQMPFVPLMNINQRPIPQTDSKQYLSMKFSEQKAHSNGQQTYETQMKYPNQNCYPQGSHVTLEMIERSVNKQNHILKSPQHVKHSALQRKQSKSKSKHKFLMEGDSNCKENMSSAGKRFAKYQKWRGGSMEKGGSYFEEVREKSDSKLLYQDDHMNEVFRTEEDQEQPRVQPFQLDQVFIELPETSENIYADPAELAASAQKLSELNNDLSNIWGESQQMKNIQATPQDNSTLHSKTFDYQQFLSSEDENGYYQVQELNESSLIPGNEEDIQYMNGSMISYTNELNQATGNLSQIGNGIDSQYNRTMIEHDLEDTQNHQEYQNQKIQGPMRNQKSRQFSLETAGFNDHQQSSYTSQQQQAHLFQQQKMMMIGTGELPLQVLQRSTEKSGDTTTQRFSEGKNSSQNITINLVDLNEKFKATSTSQIQPQNNQLPFKQSLDRNRQSSSSAMSQEAMEQKRAMLGGGSHSSKSALNIHGMQSSDQFGGISYADIPQQMMLSQDINFNMRQNLSQQDLRSPEMKAAALNHNSYRMQSNSVMSLPHHHHHYHQASQQNLPARRQSMDMLPGIPSTHGLSQQSSYIATPYQQVENGYSRKQMASPMVGNGNTSQSSFILNERSSIISQPSSKNIELLPSLLPLLKGGLFYKKFSSRQSLKSSDRAFDALNADKYPPENCGYGIRHIQLDPTLRYLNIRQHLKNTIELQIPVSEIAKPILPQITVEILKAKKASKTKEYSTASKRDRDILETSQGKNNMSHLVKIGVIGRTSKVYKQKCADCLYFPWSIALERQNCTTSSTEPSARINESSKSSTKEGRIELIATSDDVLKQWTVGINMLIKHRGARQ